MSLSKRDLKQMLKSRNYDIDFLWCKKSGSVIPNYDKDNAYSLSFEGNSLDVNSLDEAMTTKFFNGKSLNEICSTKEFEY